MKKKLLLTLGILTTTLSYGETHHHTKGVTSPHKCIKAGAPLEIDANAPHVDVEAVSDVAIGFKSSLESGEVTLDISVDEGLEVVDGKIGESTIVIKNGATNPLHIKVKSYTEGLYYIKIVAKIPQRGTRAFAVPITIGKGSPTLKRSKTTNTPDGLISESSGVETIR